MIKWLKDTYNGLFVIVLKPFMPHKRTVIALVAGFIFGMIVAYLLNPTIFYNADPSDLSRVWQREFVKLLSYDYANGGYDEGTITGYLRTVDNPVALIEDILADPNTTGTTAQNLQQMRPLADAAQPGTSSNQPPNIIIQVLGLLFWIVLFLIVAVVAILLFHFAIYPIVWQQWIMNRIRPPKIDQSILDIKAAKDAEKKAVAAQTDYAQTNLGKPTMQRMTVYIRGRGSFDESYAIEDANEMFLGECGAGIADSLVAGDEKGVSALEIWLFDKEDFSNTLTKVFASPYAYNDPVVRTKLDARGDVVLIQKDATLVLETQALRLQARIVDVEYAGGAFPPSSALQKATVELAVWQLTAGTGAPPAPARMPEPMPAPLPMSAPPLQVPQAAPQFQPPPPIPQPMQPQQPLYGGDSGMRPLAPPPLQPYQPLQQPPQNLPPARQPYDDDPFGGTGDFTPING